MPLICYTTLDVTFIVHLKTGIYNDSKISGKHIYLQYEIYHLKSHGLISDDYSIY